MELSEKTNFYLRIILFLLSLYFLFDITHQYKDIETTFGISIIVISTIVFAVIFITCFNRE